MTTVKFAEELTQLISRWTRSPVLNQKDGADKLAPLTTQQALKTLKSVVQVMLGVDLQEAPEAGIAASSPSSPAVPKIKLEQSIKLSESYRFGSLDALLPSSDLDNVNRVDLLSSKSQEEIDIVKLNTLDLLPADKFISRSNPTIHVSFSDRSDASIREQAERGALHNVTEQQRSKVKSQLFLNKIEVLRKCAADIVANIDELKKEMCPQTAKPIRRLSSIAVSPGLSGSSSLLRKVPPPNLRRSSTCFTGTSAATKLNTTVTIEKEKASARRQTIAPGSIHIKTPKILPRNRSPLVARSTSKKSPPSTLRTAKNPKYAHIQSTIPKVASTRKDQ